MTDSFDPNNREHKKIKVIRQAWSMKRLLAPIFCIIFHLGLGLIWSSFAMILTLSLRQNCMTQADIEIGDGLPDIRTTGKCLEALKQAGFEVAVTSIMLCFFLLFSLSLFLWLAQVNWQLNYLFCSKLSLYGRKISHWTRLSLGTCLWIKIISHWLVSLQLRLVVSLQETW